MFKYVKLSKWEYSDKKWLVKPSDIIISIMEDKNKVYRYIFCIVYLLVRTKLFFR